MITVEQIIQQIKSDVSLSSIYLDINKYPLPAPYCPKDRTRIKAFVLGADPSNFSDNGNTKKISVVFDIGRDKRYFNTINQNLKTIGLSLDTVYVQNIVRNYTTKETASNPHWDQYADLWLQYIKEEFDSFDSSFEIPVLLTAGKILKFLIFNSLDSGYPSDYYSGIREIPIKADENKLNRPLFPFFRSSTYLLSKQERYKEKLKKIFVEK